MEISYSYFGRGFIITSCFVYAVLLTILTGFVILTIIFGSLWLKCDYPVKAGFTAQSNRSNATVYPVANGIIGFPPRLPNDGQYVQWTFLHMNDIYELLPFDQGQRGGLARVAYMRQLLLNENPNTITIHAGDLVSPSVLGTAIVNGTALNGKQMIATMNTLGLDYMTFGNHEFDLNETELLARMKESTFTWISSNVFQLNSSEPFGTSVTHKLIIIEGVRILIIGLTINEPIEYVRFISEQSLVNFTQQFLNSFPNDTYDVLMALTHLDVSYDIELALNIPEIDLILGGHEHVNQYYLRGTTFTPIYKADANAFTVYIHRCAFNLNTKRFRIYSTLARVSLEVPEDEKTAAVANNWFNAGVQGLQQIGYQPLEVVSCLPPGVELDGIADAVLSTVTLLTESLCQSMIQATASSKTTIGIVNSGVIRLDDILSGTITQYDILRTLPYSDTVIAISVPGTLIAQMLTTSMSQKGTDMFLAYTGVETSDGGLTWFANGANIANNSSLYRVATSEYLRESTSLNSTLVTVLQMTNETLTRALLNYLTIKYPPC